MEVKRIYLYPKWLRFWHILNALMCLILIVTGISLQFSNKESSMINFHVAITWHDIAGITLSSSYLIFLIGNIITPNRKHYTLVCKGFFSRIIKQLKYYLVGMFRGEQPPFAITLKQKFNPVQQITYYTVMYIIVPVMIVSGILLLFPQKMIYSIFGINSIIFIDVVHIIGATIILLFLVIHIYFATIGHKPNSHFKSIINGYHEEIN
jgi:thiosulfate reductase cytochrome b subunit